MLHEVEDVASSFIKSVYYNDDTMDLRVVFKKYFCEEMTHINVPHEIVMELFASDSQGRYYKEKIEKVFKRKNYKAMPETTNAPKQEIVWIDCSIDVTKINKDWLLVAEKAAADGHTPVYLNFSIGYRKEKDQYGNNGMITQKVPKDVYMADKTIKGPILGNGKVWPREKQHTPGSEEGTKPAANVENAEVFDDLPF